MALVHNAVIASPYGKGVIGGFGGPSSADSYAPALEIATEDVEPNANLFYRTSSGPGIATKECRAQCKGRTHIWYCDEDEDCGFNYSNCTPFCYDWRAPYRR